MVSLIYCVPTLSGSHKDELGVLMTNSLGNRDMALLVNVFGILITPYGKPFRENNAPFEGDIEVFNEGRWILRFSSGKLIEVGTCRGADYDNTVLKWERFHPAKLFGNRKLIHEEWEEFKPYE
jgi:hypothetical protein